MKYFCYAADAKSNVIELAVSVIEADIDNVYNAWSSQAKEQKLDVKIKTGVVEFKKVA